MILLFQSFYLKAQIQIVRLSNFELSNQVSSFSEKFYYPNEGEFVIEEMVNREFDEFGRLVLNEVNEVGFEPTKASYAYNEKHLLKKSTFMDGISTETKYSYHKDKHVASEYFEIVGEERQLVKKDTLIYSEYYFKISTINPEGLVSDSREVYKDSIGRDTLHIGYLPDGTVDYERRFKYIEGTKLFTDETKISGLMVAKTDYELKSDSTHVLTTIDPEYEIFITREEKYNSKGFIEYYYVDEPMRGASSKLRYAYKYDDLGNWIERTAVNESGEVFELVERTIIYFK